MKRILGALVLLCTAAALLTLLVSGCDTPNSPGETPAGLYHLAGAYAFPTSAKQVVAQGDYAAVAAGSYGGVVLDVRDPAHIDTVFRATLASPFEGASVVALDTLNHLFFLSANPRDNGGTANPMYDYTTRQAYPDLVPTEDQCIALGVTSDHNDMRLWVSRYVGGSSGGRFAGYRVMRDADTSQWTCDGSPLLIYVYPGVTWGSPNRGVGFSRRASDGTVAISMQEAGVHFVNDSTGARISTVLLPGNAYGCAWYQDSLLVVAANLQMAVLNVQDPAHPEIISQLSIPTSDRMQGVALDGHYACMMDIYDGIYVVDLTNPRSPAYVQLLKMGSPTSVCADGGRVYATDEVAGLQIFAR